MIRSTTDAMLAARHDPEPWLMHAKNGDVRLAQRDYDATPAIYRHHAEHAPRVECIPSRYLVLLGPRGGHWREWRGIAASWDDAIERAEAANPGWDTHTAGLDVENPRPEPNPILVAFRDDPHLTTPERARDYLLYLVQHREHVKRAYNPAQIEDARKVLTRLVEVFG